MTKRAHMTGALPLSFRNPVNDCFWHKAAVRCDAPHGGKYLSRSGNVKTLEGKPLDTTFIALLEFPSAEAVQAFATDPKYAPYAAARQAGSESRFQLIDDTDVAGTIPYLPKG